MSSWSWSMASRTMDYVRPSKTRSPDASSSCTPRRSHSVQRPISADRVPLFAAASARNTGIVYAAHVYVAFVDDCIVPMPGWWSAVREAARHQYVVAGAYQRHADMCVSNGVLRSSRPLASGRDRRWTLGDECRVVPVEGGQLYTMSMEPP